MHNSSLTARLPLQIFDDVIFAFFSLEMTIKMIAMGGWGRGTYLADSWNRLDFFIVMSGALGKDP